MMTEIEFTVEPIDSIETIESNIEDYHEWITDRDDLSNIMCVDDLIESLRDYLNDTNYESEFNLDNINNYYVIDDFDELDDRFVASYDNDDEMDTKIELIDTIIKLVLINNDIEPCGAFDEDDDEFDEYEFADDEK